MKIVTVKKSGVELTSDKTQFKTKNIIGDKGIYNDKSVYCQEAIIAINVWLLIVSRYINQQLIELKGEIVNSTMIA